MIAASFVKKKNKYCYFSISGHSTFKENNSDYKLVCAGASSIVFGVLNSLSNEKEQKNKIEIKKNSVIISKISSKVESQIIIGVLYNSLLTLKEKYPKCL